MLEFIKLKALCKFGFTNTAKFVKKNDKNVKNFAKFPKNERVFTTLSNSHKNEKNNQNFAHFYSKKYITMEISCIEFLRISSNQNFAAKNVQISKIKNNCVSWKKSFVFESCLQGHMISHLIFCPCRCLQTFFGNTFNPFITFSSSTGLCYVQTLFSLNCL